MDPTRPIDPIVARRRRIGRAARFAKRVGYLALVIAIVAFGVGVVAGFSRGIVGVVVVGLVAMCLILPVPIVVAYGVRAADRDERSGAAGRTLGAAGRRPGPAGPTGQADERRSTIRDEK